jgi:hypothetical protein
VNKIAEITCLELPIDGMNCSVKGRFYYRISENGRNRDFFNCYLAESDNKDSPKIFLSDGIGDAVIDADETFGMMVGGEFAYYGVDAEIDGLVKCIPEGMAFEMVKSIRLEKDGESQEFNF